MSDIQSAVQRGALTPFQLTPAMGYVPAFLLGTNGTVRSARSRESCRGRGVVRRRIPRPLHLAQVIPDGTAFSLRRKRLSDPAGGKVRFGAVA